MSSLLESFNNYINSRHLFIKKDQLLLAVSGGVDSVVLCELCSQAGYSFSMAHCNFQLRGSESDGDELFVQQLAEKYKVPLFVKRFDTASYAHNNKVSIQVAARELRYEWFNELISQPANGLRYILTAQHADDNIETIAMNFFKGSGINGLKGIVPKKDRLLRPLLFARKEEIISYATANKLAYREDSSNRADKYTRNYFRNQLLPAIEKVYPQVKENLLHNAERFSEINTIYEAAIQKIREKLVIKKDNEYHIPVLKLKGTIAMQTVLYEVVKDFGFTSSQVPEIYRLLESESGKYIDSRSHRILKNRNWLLVAPLKSEGNTFHLVEKNNSRIEFGRHSMTIETGPKKAISKEANEVQLDLKHISFPLIIRKWKTGDYFYPLGMKKKKKLSRFLIDLKLSMHQKQDVWVLESDKRILWVIGLRIDDRFKITDSSTESLSLRLFPHGQAS